MAVPARPAIGDDGVLQLGGGTVSQVDAAAVAVAVKVNPSLAPEGFEPEAERVGQPPRRVDGDDQVFLLGGPGEEAISPG